MSRMSKFLRQECSFEKAKRNSAGIVQLDKFGDVLYSSPRTIKCRRERIVKDVQTSTGAIQRSSTRYFIDETQLVEADDRIDGKTVIEVSEYINQLGKVEGYECYV